jgi:hypothetical protein
MATRTRRYNPYTGATTESTRQRRSLGFQPGYSNQGGVPVPFNFDAPVGGGAGVGIGNDNRSLAPSTYRGGPAVSDRYRRDQRRSVDDIRDAGFLEARIMQQDAVGLGGGAAPASPRMGPPAPNSLGTPAPKLAQTEVEFDGVPKGKRLGINPNPDGQLSSLYGGTAQRTQGDQAKFDASRASVNQWQAGQVAARGGIPLGAPMTPSDRLAAAARAKIARASMTMQPYTGIDMRTQEAGNKLLDATAESAYARTDDVAAENDQLQKQNNFNTAASQRDASISARRIADLERRLDALTKQKASGGNAAQAKPLDDATSMAVTSYADIKKRLSYAEQTPGNSQQRDVQFLKQKLQALDAELRNKRIDPSRIDENGAYNFDADQTQGQGTTPTGSAGGAPPPMAVNANGDRIMWNGESWVPMT